MQKTILQLVFIVLAVNVVFISGVSAATINVEHPYGSTQVQAAINAASAGDTVYIPAANVTWDIPITLAKSITLMGAGAANTIITYNSSKTISLGTGTWRITGIGFVFGTTTGTQLMFGNRLNGWRIDHCAFTYSGVKAIKWSLAIYGYQDQPDQRGFGLFDHNTMTNVIVPVFYGGECSFSNKEWANNLGYGTADALFIEDNTIINTIGSNYETQPDANCGSRVVFRYNTLDSFNSAMHSVQGDNRSARMWEFYGNTYTSNAFPTWVVANLRGGTGVAYNNTVGNGFTSSVFALDNRRSCEKLGTVGICNGTSMYDGNRTNAYGYPCRDQIGRSTDDHQMTSTYFPAQSLSPAYFWNNKKGTVDVPAVVRTTCTNQYVYHILENRDFYNADPTHCPADPYGSCTKGVGVGTFANRPAFCTTNPKEAGGGVAYWATDTSTLYRCSSEDTWTIHYKPYIYPHPLSSTQTLRSTQTLTRPQAPQSLRIAQ